MEIKVKCTGWQEVPGPPGSKPLHNFTLTIQAEAAAPGTPQMTGTFQVFNSPELPVGTGKETRVVIGDSSPAPVTGGSLPQWGAR